MPTPPSTSIEKALDLLITLGELRGSSGLQGLAERAGVPKSSAHRLLQSLASRGLVSRTRDGDYQLGSALVVLGDLARRGDALLTASEPALREAAHVTGQSCFLVLARGGKLEVALVAEGSGFLRAMPTVGGRVPVHASASGRLYLAFDPAQVELGAASEWERFTKATPGSKRALDGAGGGGEGARIRHERGRVDARRGGRGRARAAGRGAGRDGGAGHQPRALRARGRGQLGARGAARRSRDPRPAHAGAA